MSPVIANHEQIIWCMIANIYKTSVAVCGLPVYSSDDDYPSPVKVSDLYNIRFDRVAG